MIAASGRRLRVRVRDPHLRGPSSASRLAGPGEQGAALAPAAVAAAGGCSRVERSSERRCDNVGIEIIKL